MPLLATPPITWAYKPSPSESLCPIQTGSAVESGGRPSPADVLQHRLVVDQRLTGQEHSIAVGSRGNPRGDRKCLPLKMVPASRLVIRSQQQNGFRTFLVPVDTRPLQPQVHHSADRTLDRTTADRHLQRRDPRVIHPSLLTIPLEVRTLPFQRLARARATEGVDRRLHLDHLSLQKTSPLATNPRLTLRSRPASRQGRDLAQMLHRMIEVHQLVDLFRFDPQATQQCPDAIPDPTRPIGHEQDLVCRGDG